MSEKYLALINVSNINYIVIFVIELRGMMIFSKYNYNYNHEYEYVQTISKLIFLLVFE